MCQGSGIDHQDPFAQGWEAAESECAARHCRVCDCHPDSSAYLAAEIDRTSVVVVVVGNLAEVERIGLVVLVVAVAEGILHDHHEEEVDRRRRTAVYWRVGSDRARRYAQERKPESEH